MEGDSSAGCVVVGSNGGSSSKLGGWERGVGALWARPGLEWVESFGFCTAGLGGSSGGTARARRSPPLLQSLEGVLFLLVVPEPGVSGSTVSLFFFFFF